MTALYSCPVPGRKPGTSTSDTIGMLKASQKRTNLAPFLEALTSSTPAYADGWFATMPTDCPLKRAKPMMMFLANFGCTSKNSPLSVIAAITLYMSYAWFGSSGIISLSESSTRLTGSVHSLRGASSMLFDGIYDIRVLIISMPSSSVFAVK